MLGVACRERNSSTGSRDVPTMNALPVPTLGQVYVEGFLRLFSCWFSSSSLVSFFNRFGTFLEGAFGAKLGPKSVQIRTFKASFFATSFRVGF